MSISPHRRRLPGQLRGDGPGIGQADDQLLKLLVDQVDPDRRGVRAGHREDPPTRRAPGADLGAARVKRVLSTILIPDRR